MVILNCYGKIPKICISNKLKLYISNLPDEKDNNWQSELTKELVFRSKLEKFVLKSYDEKCSFKDRDSLKSLYCRVFNCENKHDEINEQDVGRIASNMICIYFDYDYDDMPLGGWETNCFDGRLCEEDYAEKIIDFINFFDHDDRFPKPTPQWIYSSNHSEMDRYRIFWGGEDIDTYIDSLTKWGEWFDHLLETIEDYYLLDYLCNAIHFDGHYDTYHFVKLYSICQLFLENEKESELDMKLPQFFNCHLSIKDRKIQARLFRQIRNKIAHGDYCEFNKKIEEYTTKIMDGRYAFDYSEYSRQNWALLNSCCELKDALQNIIYLLFTNKDELNSIKKEKY